MPTDAEILERWPNGVSSKYDKELFAIVLGNVRDMCRAMLLRPETIPEGWADAIGDMKLRSQELVDKWRQVR